MSVELDGRVLVLLPSAEDARLVERVLGEEGAVYAPCVDMTELCGAIRAGASAAIIAEEAIEADQAGALSALLRSQSRWSDFPLVVLARDKELGRPLDVWMNTMLVERPIGVRPLVSVVRAALRSRRHQYEVRKHLRAHKQAEKALEESRQRLARVLDAARMATWDWD